ncbi:MAG: glycosyltransferase family 2 protein [Candidatus Eisenbacteria bacterium]|nr:glycosyltransferase family 2 protein [Candidatus Eisenbacteria bacterium]
MSRVSAVVVNWNAREDTRECIESLTNSDYPELDVILVDNASSDGSVEYLRSLFPRVTIVENLTNERFALGSNKGMRLALDRGAQCVFLFNNDAVVEKTTIGKLAEALEGTSGAGLVGPKILYSSRKDVIWSAGGEVNFWTGITRHRGIREKDAGQYDRSTEVGYLTGCALMARRELIAKIGFLDPSYHMYGEDADWCLRARKAGFGIVYVPDARVWHKVSLSTGGEFSAGKLYEKTRSNLLLLSRHARPYHWITIPFSSLFYLFRLFVQGIWRRNLDVPRTIVGALGDGVRKRDRHAK